MQNEAPLYAEYGRWVVAGVAAFFASIPQLTWLLMALMLIDMAFSFGVAILKKNVEPSSFQKEATDKLGRLAIIAIGGMFDTYLTIPGINWMMAATIFYIGPELLSIFRNAALIGIPIPPQMVSILRAFQEQDKNATADPQESRRPLDRG